MNAEDDDEIPIVIDSTEKISSVSMLIYYGVYYEGLRFYDETNDRPIVDVKWNDSPMGKWTEPQAIPDDKFIIGVKANTVNDNYITSLSFILCPKATVHTDEVHSSGATYLTVTTLATIVLFFL